jgi:DNA polymerase III epsilon subunit-like protein
VFRVNKWGVEAAKIHGISKELSDMMPLDPPVDPWEIMRGDMADYVVAHNAEHDHPLITTRWSSFLRKPWLCTRADIIHSDAVGLDGQKLLHRQVGSTRLGHLCVDYGINLTGWHRALADAEACARIAACHDLAAALKRKNEPKYKLLTFGKYIDNAKEILQEAPSVKRNGKRYQWDSNKKSWAKEGLTEQEVIEDGAYIEQVTKNRWKFSLEPLPPKTY